RFICESRGKRIGPYTRNAWIITRGAANGEEVVGVPPHKSSMADKVEEQILWCLYGLPHHCSPLLKEVTNGPIDLVWTLIRIEEVQEILLGKPKLLWIQQVSSNATGDIGECFGAREVRVIWPLTRTEQDCECGLRRRGMLIHSRVLSWLRQEDLSQLRCLLTGDVAKDHFSVGRLHGQRRTGAHLEPIAYHGRDRFCECHSR